MPDRWCPTPDASQRETVGTLAFIFSQESHELPAVFFFVAERRDADILSDVVETITQLDQLGVLSNRGILRLNHSLNDAHNVRQLCRRLQTWLSRLERSASGDDSAQSLDAFCQSLSMHQLSLNVRLQ